MDLQELFNKGKKNSEEDDVNKREPFPAGI